MMVSKFKFLNSSPEDDLARLGLAFASRVSGGGLPTAEASSR